jgi:hypothetical protein
MLRASKHLFVRHEQKQILRYAQNDMCPKYWDPDADATQVNRIGPKPRP